VAYVDHLGVLAAEEDDERKMLGNFPQAFSPISRVNTALAISEAARCLATPAG
jgi:GH15 family glucan-1,4-alpha-glucosidase